MKVKVGNHEVEPGCWVAGHHGQYAVDCAATIADTLLGTNYTRRVSHARQGHSLESSGDLFDLWDEVEAVLNENTEDGFVWNWVEGELFLCDLAEAEEEL